jgi:hypothetical protein
MRLSAAALDVMANGSESNVHDYYHAWTVESWLFRSWMLE